MEITAIYLGIIFVCLTFAATLLTICDFAKKCIGWLSIRFSNNAFGILLIATVRQLLSIFFLATLMIGSFFIYLKITKASPMYGFFIGSLEHSTNNIIGQLTIRPASSSDLNLILKFLFGVFAGVLASQLVSKVASLNSDIGWDVYNVLKELNTLICKGDPKVGAAISANESPITKGKWEERSKGIKKVIKEMRLNRKWIT